MGPSKCYWVLAACNVLLGKLCVYAACSEPLGVANAYMTSSSPYNTNDRVYFRCYDGFTMSGTPSLLCLSSGSFSGTYPACVSNDEAVTIRQIVNSPKDDGNSGWMMLAFGSFIGLILLLLIVFALVFFYFMHKRQAEQTRHWQRRVTQLQHRDSIRYPATTASSCVTPSQMILEENPDVPTFNLSPRRSVF